MVVSLYLLGQKSCDDSRHILRQIFSFAVNFMANIRKQCASCEKNSPKLGSYVRGHFELIDIGLCLHNMSKKKKIIPKRQQLDDATFRRKLSAFFVVLWQIVW